MPPEPVRARTWGTRLRPTTSPTSVSETERERMHLSFMVCPPSHDDEKYDALEGACQGGRSQDCRQRAAVEPIGTGRSPASLSQCGHERVSNRALTMRIYDQLLHSEDA